jgi:hypothetical protein
MRKRRARGAKKTRRRRRKRVQGLPAASGPGRPLLPSKQPASGSQPPALRQEGRQKMRTRRRRRRRTGRRSHC